MARRIVRHWNSRPNLFCYESCNLKNERKKKVIHRWRLQLYSLGTDSYDRQTLVFAFFFRVLFYPVLTNRSIFLPVFLTKTFQRLISTCVNDVHLEGRITITANFHAIHWLFEKERRNITSRSMDKSREHFLDRVKGIFVPMKHFLKISSKRTFIFTSFSYLSLAIVENIHVEAFDQRSINCSRMTQFEYVK